MELKQKQRLSKEEFDRLTGEIRTIVGDRFKNHKDGDAEQLLLKEF